MITIQQDLSDIVHYIGGQLVSGGAAIPVTQDADTVLFNKVAGEIQGFKTLTGTPVPTVSYDVASMSALLAIDPTTIDGEVIRVTKAALTGDGKQDFFMFSDGTILRPFGGRQILFNLFSGDIASSAETISAAGEFALTANPIIPANLVTTNGMALEIGARVHRRGVSATNMIFRIWLGTDADHTLNTILLTKTLTNTDLLDPGYINFNYRASSTKVTSTRDNSINGAGGASTYQDSTTNINWAADQTLSFGVSSIDAVNNLDLVSYYVALVG